MLKRVAEIILQNIRAGELAIRLGGEEFVIFVVGKSAQNIQIFMDRLRKRVEQSEFTGAMAERRITISIGIAHRVRGEVLTDFIERADKALYIAKNTGRNRICMADM